MAGLYLHIPFCKQACHYCDFHFSTNQESRLDILRSMTEEMVLRKDYLHGETLSTVYFGGGTPSLLEPDETELLWTAIHRTFAINPAAEVTLEANPDELNAGRLSNLKATGINRLSIGIQSFDDDILKYLNRAHSSHDALRSVENARKAGFENLSVDLIYAIPGQSLDQWRDNIKQTLALSPEHISTYALTIEPKTAFGIWQQKGKLVPVPDADAAIQYELLMELLDAAGYEHYEISNFGRPGFHSRHNTSYWQQVPYLGIGPSAHSYDRTSRQYTISNNELYRKAIIENSLRFEREVLTRENKINEYVFTTMRTVWGCDLDKLNSDFGFDLYKANQPYLDTLIVKHIVHLENNVLTLTRRGKLLADQIASDLFVNPVTD